MNAARPVIVVGGGLVGSLAALEIARLGCPNLLLIEQSKRFGGGLISPFFLSDIPPACREVVEPLIVSKWPRYKLANAEDSWLIDNAIGYADPGQVHAEIIQKLAPDRWRLLAEVQQVFSNHVILKSGELIAASLVVDCRPQKIARNILEHPAKTTTRLVILSEDHGLCEPILMDNTLGFTDALQVHCFPVSRRAMLTCIHNLIDRTERNMSLHPYPLPAGAQLWGESTRSFDLAASNLVYQGRFLISEIGDESDALMPYFFETASQISRAVSIAAQASAFVRRGKIRRQLNAA